MTMADDSITPIKSGLCAECGEEVDYHQFNGRHVDDQLWHDDCWFEKKGYRPIEDSEDIPICSCCNGWYTHRRDRDEFPMPDAEGKIVDYGCTSFEGSTSSRISVETPVREFTEDDWDFLESVAGTDHWFSRWATLIHPDLSKNRGVNQ